MDVHDFEQERWSRGEQEPQFRHAVADILVGDDSSVVDVGCGDGLLMSMLKARGVKVFGFDLSPKAVERVIARGMEAQVLDFAAHPLPIEDNSYDVAIALDVLEHLYHPETLLKELARVAPDVVIGVPNFSSLPARIQVVFGKVPENNHPHKGHIFWFTLSVLKSMANSAGLCVVESRYNTLWMHVPVLGGIMRILANCMPSIFALSFVIRFSRVEKTHE